MKKKKWMIAGLIIVFMLSVVLYFITEKQEKAENEQKKKEEEVITDYEAPETDFKFDQVEYSYHNALNEINIEKLLEEKEQLHYFQYTLYEYLVNSGYDDIKKVEVSGGVQTGENVDFSVNVYTTDDKLLEMKANYDMGLYSFFYHFVKDELQAKPVDIINLDSVLEKELKNNLKQIEKEFGEYLFTEKLSATRAQVTSYEGQGDMFIIQVELNDEYQTYCKIFFNVKTKEYHFKKWG